MKTKIEKSMTKESGKFNRRMSVILLVLALLTSAFWLAGRWLDYYQIELSGVFFELLWLPMIGLLFFLPIFSLLFWVREKFAFRSLFWISLLICLATIVFMFASE